MKTKAKKPWHPRATKAWSEVNGKLDFADRTNRWSDDIRVRIIRESDYQRLLELAGLKRKRKKPK